MSPYTILVKGLPEDAGVDAVREFFSRAGYITECTVDKTSATISFDNEDDFNEAIRMDGLDFGNGAIIQVSKKLEVEEQDKNQEQAQGEASDITAEVKESEGNEPKSTEGGEEASRDPRKRIREEFKIAVRHLAENTTEEQLRELFTSAGNIVDLFLDQRRRYAFIGFDTAEAVEAALLLTGREVNGGPVDVERKRASPRENVLDFKVVVKGLPPNTTDATLRAFFAAAGEPVDVFIHDKKNFAFVGFADEAACEQALRMAGQELEGCRLDVERRQRQRCFKCNREGHVALQCRAPELSCRNCGRPGHVIRDCRAPPRDRDHRFMHHNNYNNNNNNNNNNFHRNNNSAMHHNSMRGPHQGGYNNNYNNAPGGERRVFYNNNNNNGPITDRRDYRGGDRREDKKDHYGDRRRARSRSDSYERKHRRRSRSRSRSRSPKRFARDRDRERSRSPPRRRY